MTEKHGDADTDLIARIKAGQQDALTALFERHRGAVFWTAMRVLYSRPDAEEIAVDAFLTLWEKRKKVSLYGESALPWLLVTTKHLARNRARAIQRRYATRLDDEPERQSTALSVEEQVELNEAIATLDRILASLSFIDRQVFALCVVEDLPYKQAAHNLGISHASVRNRLSRVRHQLRDGLSM